MNELGNWISQEHRNHFMCAKSLMLKRNSKGSSICLWSWTVYFHLNGQKVADHELDPGWTNYDKKIQYVKFDITDLVHTGKNVLGAEVGNGWFIKRMNIILLAFQHLCLQTRIRINHLGMNWYLQ